MNYYDVLTLVNKLIKKKPVYAGGIREYLREQRSLGIKLLSIGLLLLIVSAVVVFYSLEIRHFNSSQESLYNSIVSDIDSSKIIKPSPGLLTSETVITNYFTYYSFIGLAVVSLLSIALGIILFLNISSSFLCPHCKKRILLKNINRFTCPACNNNNLDFKSLSLGCSKCGEEVYHIYCIHCNASIDLTSNYSESNIIRSRYV